MKSYRVYVDGKEVPQIIKAPSHNAAEKKAQKLFPVEPSYRVSVEYTEL